LARYVGAELPEEGGSLGVLQGLVRTILEARPANVADVLARSGSSMQSRGHSAEDEFLDADAAAPCARRDEIADGQQEALRASA
jgi:hypothetical protein